MFLKNYYTAASMRGDSTYSLRPYSGKKPGGALTGWVKPIKIYFDKHRIEFIKVKP